MRRDVELNSAVCATPCSVSVSAVRVARAAVSVKSTSARGAPVPGAGAGALPRSPLADGAPTAVMSASASSAREPAGRPVEVCRQQHKCNGQVRLLQRSVLKLRRSAAVYGRLWHIEHQAA